MAPLRMDDAEATRFGDGHLVRRSLHPTAPGLGRPYLLASLSQLRGQIGQNDRTGGLLLLFFLI